MPYLLKNLHHSLRQVIEEGFRREGFELSFAHFATLYTLANEPGVAGAELARRGFVTAQTMNTILRRMEKEGDIERRPHPGNARADSWHLTEAGQVRLARAKRVGEAVWKRMLSTLKEREVEQLRKLLRRCIQGLDRQVESPRSERRSPASTPARRRKKAAKSPTGRRLG